jgi:hypothetical protein
MRGLVLVCALLALAGCKKPKTAADADTQDGSEARLLAKGERPRAILRYNIAGGTTTTSTATFRVATVVTSPEVTATSVQPGLRLGIVSGPAQLTDRGVRFDIDVVKSEALVPAGFEEEGAALLRSGAAILDGIGGWVEIDDRGRMLAGRFNEQTKRSDVPVRLLHVVLNARQTLTRVVLPEEPVGLGGRWETRRPIKAYGFSAEQVSTYTLVDRAGDEIMLDVAVRQFGGPQTVEFPEEGIELSLELMTAQAQGQIILDLDALESDAAVTGTAENRILVKTVQGTEPVQVREKFEAQIANTSALPGR